MSDVPSSDSANPASPPSGGSDFTLWACGKDLPCKDPGLCCGKNGFCSAAADACDVENGCQGNCKAIPDAKQCQTFKSELFQDMNAVKTRPMYTEELKVKGILNTTQIYQPSSVQSTAKNCNSILASADYPIQPCDLVNAMGGSENCKYCLYYYDRLREAIEAYDMVSLAQPTCDAPVRQGAIRLASILAQIRHETNGLKDMYQQIDRGAGALHMLPSHFESVVSAIPRLAKAVDSTLPGLVWKNVESDIKLQRIIGLIISAPEHTFLTAGWWFVKGAQTRLDPMCGDLRSAADLGLGNVTSDSSATGFYKVSRCIYSSALMDPGSTQRLSYYYDAMNVTSLFTPVAESLKVVPPSNPTTDQGKDSSTMNFPSILVFVSSFVGVFLVGVAFMSIYDKLVWSRHRRRPRQPSRNNSTSSSLNKETYPDLDHSPDLEQAKTSPGIHDSITPIRPPTIFGSINRPVSTYGTYTRPPPLATFASTNRPSTTFAPTSLMNQSSNISFAKTLNRPATTYIYEQRTSSLMHPIHSPAVFTTKTNSMYSRASYQSNTAPILFMGNPSRAPALLYNSSNIPAQSPLSIHPFTTYQHLGTPSQI